MRFGMIFPTLYWCAGVLKRAKLETQGWRDIFEMVDINLRNPLMLVRNMRSEPRATGGTFHLVTVASTTGLSDSPREDEAVYAATKSAQVSFTRAVGKGSQDPSFKASLFCPSGMHTPFWKNEQGVDMSNFLDPKKVATAIVADVEKQTEPYYERVIPRGSL
jgi:short-subunit dehydrogenase